MIIRMDFEVAGKKRILIAQPINPQFTKQDLQHLVAQEYLYFSKGGVLSMNDLVDIKIWPENVCPVGHLIDKHGWITQLY